MSRPRAGALALLLAFVVFAAGCASARIRRETLAGLREADALAARGCHGCLIEALARYQRLTPGDATLRARVDRAVFRVSLILAVREKEIGLEARAHLERARAFAGVHGTPADRERVELADRLPWNAAGLPRDVLMQQNQRAFGAPDRVVARLARAPVAASDDPELDAYLDLSFFCTGRFKTDPSRTAASFLPPGDPSLLLQYRIGACQSPATTLEAVLAAEPRFLEVLVFIARARLASAARGGPRAVARVGYDALVRARRAFPESAALTMELAGQLRPRSPRQALPLYEDVVARVPAHQDAWFGKALCESYTSRHDAAVVTLTHLLGMGQWLTADALYWRAWNRHQLRQLETAQQDVERAKTLLYNTDVFALAGIIAHDREQYDAARPDLERALEISSRNCGAAWYLGLTNAAQARWPAASGAFERAASCYRSDADDGRQQLAAAEALEESDGRTEQIASARTTIEQSLRQEALSAYNAGYGFVRADDPTRARPLLELARQHADVRARADELLTWVDRPRP